MYHLRAFLRLILLNSQVCPLGEVVDYFIRLEFQLHSSPDAPMLLCDLALSDFNTPAGITYIHGVVTFYIPEEIDMKDLMRWRTDAQAWAHQFQKEDQRKSLSFSSTAFH